jgi:hypothetical protein
MSLIPLGCICLSLMSLIRNVFAAAQGGVNVGQVIRSRDQGLEKEVSKIYETGVQKKRYINNEVRLRAHCLDDLSVRECARRIFLCAGTL